MDSTTGKSPIIYHLKKSRNKNVRLPQGLGTSTEMISPPMDLDEPPVPPPIDAEEFVRSLCR